MATLIPRALTRPPITGFIVPSLRHRSVPALRHTFRRPTATISRLAPFTLPLNGIVVPGPPHLSVLLHHASRTFSPVLKAFYAYGRAQNKRPYTVQLLTSLAIYLLGDINAQLLFGEKDKPYDPVRTLRMLAIGGILSAPSYRWFLYLSNLFSGLNKPLAVGLRVIINQLGFTPVFLTAFFSLQSALTGASAEETAERLQQTLPTAYKNSCQLWPAVSAINFYWIKLEYRSVFSGVVAIGWNAYLSYLTQRAEEVEVDERLPVVVPEVVMAPVKVVESPAPTRDYKLLVGTGAGVDIAI